MHDHKSTGMPIGQGVTLVIAKKSAAGPGGYADFGTGPDFPAMPDSHHADPDGEPDSSELGEEIRAISDRLCEIATAMATPEVEMPGDEGPEDADSEDDSDDDAVGKKRELS